MLAELAPVFAPVQSESAGAAESIQQGAKSAVHRVLRKGDPYGSLVCRPEVTFVRGLLEAGDKSRLGQAVGFRKPACDR